MSEKTRLGLLVMGCGLLLGLAGDVLLRSTPWGLNFTLWIAALVAAAFALKRRARGTVGGRAGSALAEEGAWALPCAFVFAAAFVWRDSPTLRVLDGLAVLALLSVALLGGRGGRVLRAGATDYWLAGVAAVVAAIFAPLLLVGNDVRWDELPRKGWARHVFAAVRGLLIAVPLLLLFGGLFAAADAAFAGLINRALDLDPGIAASHFSLSLFVAWVSAGYLRSLLLARPGGGAGGERTARAVLGFHAAAKRGGQSPLGITNSGAAVDARPSGVAADVVGRAGGGDSYWLPPPPSVTELTGENTRHAPPSIVGEPPPAAAPALTAERIGTTEKTETAGAQKRAQQAETPGTAGADETAGTMRATGAAGAGGAGRSQAGDGASGMRLGVIEVAVALGLLNALFMSFVAVQIRYLFGGAAVVAQTAGMTYAEYARRGFFELVWVAMLVLPLLLAAHWLLRKERPAHERVFRVLAGGLLSMLCVVLASALWRMRLYQSEYGQTELRFYTTAFIGWLALVFVWFALTVLRGRRERFAFGALVGALAVLGLLNAVNPSARIVRANAALARERGAFDAGYATSLGADAVPALIDAAPQLGRRDRAEVARRLLGQGPGRSDWRSWNLSRARAARVVGEDEALLRGWALEATPGPEAGVRRGLP